MFGPVRRELYVDTQFFQRLVETVTPMQVTLHHSALDKCDETYDLVLPRLHAVGVHRIITTGRATNVMQGKGEIKRLLALEKAGKAPIITAATGVNAANVKELIATTGVSQVHASKVAEVAAALGCRPRPLPLGAASL